MPRGATRACTCNQVNAHQCTCNQVNARQCTCNQVNSHQWSMATNGQWPPMVNGHQWSMATNAPVIRSMATKLSPRCQGMMMSAYLRSACGGCGRRWAEPPNRTQACYVLKAGHRYLVCSKHKVPVSCLSTQVVFTQGCACLSRQGLLLSLRAIAYIWGTQATQAGAGGTCAHAERAGAARAHLLDGPMNWSKAGFTKRVYCSITLATSRPLWATSRWMRRAKRTSSSVSTCAAHVRGQGQIRLKGPGLMLGVCGAGCGWLAELAK